MNNSQTIACMYVEVKLKVIKFADFEISICKNA